MIDSNKVKEILFSLGADLCGIASIDRFEDAPKGYHPLDVMPSCKSVISFGCRFPVGTLVCETPVPYTRVSGIRIRTDGAPLFPRNMQHRRQGLEPSEGTAY